MNSFYYAWPRVSTDIFIFRPFGVKKCKQIAIIQCVPLATEPGISLIILPLMRILQRNLKRT